MHSHSQHVFSNLKPGTYKIVNVKGGTAIDLSSEDGKSVIAFTEKYQGDSNQQWTFERLGAGYSIRNVRNGAYLSVNLKNAIGQPIETSYYPVSWELVVFDSQNNIYRIGWPGGEYVFDLRDYGNPKAKNKIDLHGQGMETWKLWRLIECPEPSKAVPSQLLAEWDSTTVASDSDSTTERMIPTPTAGKTIADTVVDAEGL
ncbi:hypothetical protein E1B28_007649 [Marasmius oreades]|uniref:Ricin B lectin domain-containing protein n=1 Tax=Marasmius oreades TaxID=181124 RepID=A0A9P7S2S5_9AGAR|nr:uncharacterized protein E1B28_007649 [Marasmius oreades]KAG7094027.1 hypothetical protein E1B28_007649 [Marasmius oreades]